MKRSKFIQSTVAGAVAAPAIVRSQQAAKWKMQSMWSSAELTYKVFEELCARINKLSAGRLEITPFAAGAVTGAFETLDAVSAGVLQGHSSWPGYFSGKDPGLAVISDFVFGYQHPWQAEAWYYQKGGLDMLREAYAKYNAYPVGVSWWGVESIVAKKPIKNMADFKGVVDAADWATVSMNQRMGFHEVAKFPLIIDHSMPVQEFTVNLATWKALPEDTKAIVSTAVRQWTWDQVQRVAVDDVRVMKELKAKGIERIRWDEAEMHKVRELAHKTWEDWSKKGPLAKRAFDSQVAWLKDLGLIA